MDKKEIIDSILRLERKILAYKKRNRLLYYNSGAVVHQKQVEFHKCCKRNRWVFGGNRSGKSECGAAEAVWIARGNHPYRENKADVAGWVVSLSREVQREVAQSKVLSYINPDWIVDVVMVSGRAGNPSGGIIDYISIKNVMGGIGRIGFKSCEMGRDKFQGASLDFVWFDEEPPEDIYDECLMRVIDRSGLVFGTMTPLLGLTFVYNRIYLNERGDGEVWHTFMEWADNPYLPKGEIQRLTASMTKEELESRRYGKFIAAGGLVYPEFDENIHVIDLFEVPKEWFDTMSIDPGLNNPLSCHWYACDGDDTVYVIAEHYQAGRDIGWHCEKIKTICGKLEWHTDSFGRYTSYIDSAANQRTLAASKSVSELFVENGIQVNSAVDKNLFAGIARVKDYLKVRDGKPNIYIFSNCVNLIREIKGYWWGEGDLPKKRDDHALDELRYYLMSRPEGAREKGVKGEIGKDKERLIRKSRHRQR